MTKILLLSDTHRYIDARMLRYISEADEVWHAGDIGSFEVADAIRKLRPLRAVYGNIDNAEMRSVFPLDNRFYIEDTDVWITHIGGYPGRYEARIRATLKENAPDIFISGHSHILKIMYDKQYDLLHLNPGAAGKNGFHKVRTMLRFSLDKKVVKNMEIIELEKRS